MLLFFSDNLASTPPVNPAAMSIGHAVAGTIKLTSKASTVLYPAERIKPGRIER